MYQAYSIASDIDGTMFKNDGVREFLKFLETRGCPNAYQIYCEKNSWSDATGMLREEISELYAEFINDHVSGHPLPLPGAAEAFKAIEGRNNIHLITSRSAKTRKFTLLNIAQAFGCRIASVMFDAEDCKPDCVAKVNAYVYFEDNLIQARKVCEVAEVILIPNPEARNLLVHPRIILTQAHREIAGGMSEDDWHKVWRKVWEEIPHIVRDLRITKGRSIGCVKSVLPRTA